ncbi:MULTISPECIES: hypothetical protein [Pseudidiomarina]|uniref:Cardiolipin synthase N-terminal domain-containing protein n=2 Tax=Pseudidiomarina TaxID=2800384 RepID=A0A432YCY3_9GAMM|nr:MULTISPECIES: hypothetical protein [Pseudidiomarina]MDS0219576.1 hypothetical protein [Pseudidiomarina andamanensis]PHR65745.1 MAG: hypothetical protein COA51_04395 [Idiomarina sp.]QGT95795.1 hypothetical protein D3795_06300 [Pseudidiomarina andamanensis]RUO58839.1 hypothetical protein CWI76_10355 [Pseudidiomarina marina]
MVLEHSFTSGLGIFYLLLTATVHVVLAIAVYSNALATRRAGKDIYLLNGFFWFVLTLVSGIPSAALYWFVNKFERA